MAIWLLENWPQVDVQDIEIVGSDIDTQCVTAARQGEFGARALMRLAPSLVEKYFVATGTDRGNEVLAHVAAIADEPFAANVINATPGSPWQLRRTRWGGSLLEDAAIELEPALVAIDETTAGGCDGSLCGAPGCRLGGSRRGLDWRGLFPDSHASYETKSGLRRENVNFRHNPDGELVTR